MIEHTSATSLHTSLRTIVVVNRGLHPRRPGKQNAPSSTWAREARTCLVHSETKGPTGITRGLATLIGLAEPAGGLGVILPMATSFAPWLTARTGIGLTTIMLPAIGFHVCRHESPAPRLAR
jgi:hypothetical protein